MYVLRQRHTCTLRKSFLRALARNQNWLAGMVLLSCKMCRVVVMCCTVWRIMIIRWQLQGQWIALSYQKSFYELFRQKSCLLTKFNFPLLETITSQQSYHLPPMYAGRPEGKCDKHKTVMLNVGAVELSRPSKKKWIPAFPLGKQSSHFSCLGPLLAQHFC